MTTKSVAFSFDGLEILSATKESVILKGRILDYSDADYDACFVYIERQQFHKLLDKWLNDKSDYRERYGHFCGVGDVWVEAKELKNEKAFITVFDEKTEKCEEKPVRSFVGISYVVDMEHG